MKKLRFRSGLAVVTLAMLAIATLAGCASSPYREAQWIDPAMGTQSRFLRGEKVLVACDAYDVALRQICQDRVRADVISKGGNPVVVPASTTLLNNRELDAQLVGTAAALGAKAILIVSLTPATAAAEASGLSLGIGGFSFGSGGGGVGVGLSAPIGGGRVSTGFAANGRVTDVATQRLVWTASMTATPSNDYATQIGALSRSMLDAAQDAGLF